MCTRRKQNSTFKKFNWVKTRVDPVFLLQIWQKAIPETEMDSLFSQRQKKTSKKKGGRTPKSRKILAESRFLQLWAPSK